MAKLSLKHFSLSALQDILDSMGGSLRIFHSEAQFQFALAWEIQLRYTCQVLLEEYTASYSGVKKTKKKMYTDIIIKGEEGDTIGLELKYKTDEYNKGIYHLFKQGATDLGRYDYLSDVHRLELLSKKHKSSDIEIFCPIIKGYAILLTNEHKYWSISHNVATKTIYKEFCIGEQNRPKGLYGTKLDWQLPYTSTVTKERAHAISLSQRYMYQWRDYCNTGIKNGLFRYMIIEIM